MPSRVPMSSAARDGAEEAGQRAPPTKADQVPKVSVCREVSHLAQLPSERPFPSAPQLQRGQQGRCKPVAEVRRAPTSPGLRRGQEGLQLQGHTGGFPQGQLCVSSGPLPWPSQVAQGSYGRGTPGSRPPTSWLYPRLSCPTGAQLPGGRMQLPHNKKGRVRRSCGMLTSRWAD